MFANVIIHRYFDCSFLRAIFVVLHLPVSGEVEPLEDIARDPGQRDLPVTPRRRASRWLAVRCAAPVPAVVLGRLAGHPAHLCAGQSAPAGMEKAVAERRREIALAFDGGGGVGDGGTLGTGHRQCGMLAR